MERLARTSLTFILWEVPAPAWYTSTTNHSRNLPARISSAAWTIASAFFASSNPSALLTTAAARLIWTVASTYDGFGFNPLLFPMWVVFLISSMAETFRTPFDLTEAESELVAGFQTEYSSMSFALFWLGEYGNVILMCALNAILFWGGWLPPLDIGFLYWIPGIFWLLLKMCVFFFIFGWVRATVPRYRYDQLMRLGWKIFLPLSLVFVVLVSGWLMLTRYGAGS